MNPEDIDHIITILEQRLGPTAKYAFELAVRQVYIDALSWGLLGFGMLLAGGLLARKAYLRAQESTYNADSEMLAALGVIIAGVGFFLLAFTVPQLLNPEWAALKNLGSLLP